jgi:CDP-glucose 4,6-dehydratase
MGKTVGALLRHLSGPILVTGHTGFKGTWLMRYLKELEIEAIGYSLAPKAESLYSRAGLLGENIEQFSDIGAIDKFYDFAAALNCKETKNMQKQLLMTTWTF